MIQPSSLAFSYATTAAARSVAKNILRGSITPASSAERRISALAGINTPYGMRAYSSLRSNQKRPSTSPMASASAASAKQAALLAGSPAQQQQQASQRRANPFNGPVANSVVAYVGPYMRSLQSGKSVAFVFGACGCMAVPATLYLGNTEQLLAVTAGLVSLSPSILLHGLTRHDVSKIFVEGSASKTTPSAVRVSSSDDNSIQMTIEQLNWRGKPKTTSVASKDLVVDASASKGNKIMWKLPGSIGRREERFRIDKAMMMSNPSFAFVLDQIEEQTKRKKAEAEADQDN